MILCRQAVVLWCTVHRRPSVLCRMPLALLSHSFLDNSQGGDDQYGSHDQRDNEQHDNNANVKAAVRGFWGKKGNREKV